MSLSLARGSEHEWLRRRGTGRGVGLDWSSMNGYGDVGLDVGPLTITLTLTLTITLHSPQYPLLYIYIYIYIYI